MDLNSEYVKLNLTYFNITSQVAGFHISEQVVFSAIFIVFILLSVLGNGVVCFVVYRKPEMRSAINLLLANLTLYDALLSALCVPFDVLTLANNRWIFGEVFCSVHAAIQNLLVFEANILLLIISIDRYLIIVQKWDKLNKRHVQILMTACWTFGIFLLFPPAVGWWSSYEIGQRQSHCHLAPATETTTKFYAVTVILITYILPYFFMIGIYICIFNTVRRSFMRIDCQPGYFIKDLKRFSVGTVDNQHRVMNIDYRFKTRTFSTILLIFLFNVACKAPYGVSAFLWSYSDADATKSYIYVLLLLYMNQVINPLIFLCQIEKLRLACWEILPSYLRCSESTVFSGRRWNPVAIYRVRETFLQGEEMEGQQFESSI